MSWRSSEGSGKGSAVCVGRTFCSIRCLVVFGEPLQVLVLHPGDPVVVLAVVEVASLFLVGLALGGLIVVCHFDVSEM